MRVQNYKKCKKDKVKHILRQKYLLKLASFIKTAKKYINFE